MGKPGLPDVNQIRKDTNLRLGFDYVSDRQIKHAEGGELLMVSGTSGIVYEVTLWLGTNGYSEIDTSQYGRWTLIAAKEF